MTEKVCSDAIDLCLDEIFFYLFCHSTIPQFNTLNNALARCPHCRKVSSVGPEFARGRGILFLALGIVFLIIGLGVTMATYRYAKVTFTQFTSYN